MGHIEYNFDEMINRHGTYSMKWDCGDMIKEMGLSSRFDEDTIPVFTADMDFQTPQPVLDALHAMIDKHRMFGYTGTVGTPEYYEAIISWFHRHHNWDIEKESICYVNGTVEALGMAVEAYSEPGDSILITRPVYGPFTSAIEGRGRKVVNSQLVNEDGYYTMDFEDIEQKAKDTNAKMFILCSPHNPTGRVWTEDELKKLSDICVRTNMILIADEVHCDILRKGVQFVPAGVVCAKENTVVLNAINKTFNLAGLHCSHAVIADEALRKKYQDKLGMRMPSPFAVAALIAAYNEGDDWLEQVLAYIDGTIDWCLDFLKKEMPKVRCRRPEGTYVLWMDFSEYGLTEKEISKRIYEQANVLLEPGSMFDPECGTLYQRICTPSPRPLMQEAFRRIAAEFK